MNSNDPNFDWHKQGVWVVHDPLGLVLVHTAGSTPYSVRAEWSRAHTGRWQQYAENGWTIQEYAQPAVAASAPAAPPVTAVSQIDAAVAAITEARRINKHLQNGFKPDLNEWHVCEAVDDKLHDALVALGT